MTWSLRIVAALLAVAALTYFATPLFRPGLTEAERVLLGGEREPGMPEELERRFDSSIIGRMHVRVLDPGEGDAGVVILLHGFSNPSYVWRDYFKPLADAGYMVVAPDFYGRGFSDRPDRAYDEALFLHQVDSIVAYYSKDRPVHLIGYSMGGAIAARYAAKHPGKVETVGLIAPAGLQCGGSLSSPMTWPVFGDWAFRVLGPWFLESYSGADWAQAKDPEYWRARYREMAKYRGYEDALVSTLRNFNFWDSCDAMKAVKASGKRVLAVFAEDDKTIPIAHADTLASFPGDARIVRAPGRGHGLTFAAPESVIPEILKLVSLEP